MSTASRARLAAELWQLDAGGGLRVAVCAVRGAGRRWRAGSWLIADRKKLEDGKVRRWEGEKRLDGRCRRTS
jgi:hypothetical protein